MYFFLHLKAKQGLSYIVKPIQQGHWLSSFRLKAQCRLSAGGLQVWGHLKCVAYITAACGVACVVVALYAGLTIRAVAADGDRFDYWVDDGAYEYGLEVSGTMGAALNTRHRAKVRQLCDNPYGVDGYVVVVSFITHRVIMSFNRYQEQSQ